jgi:nitrite reductase (NADH) small subunit
MPWIPLCRLDELKEDRGHYVEVGRHQLAVFLHHGEPYVMDNYCPHAGGNLAGGIIEDGCAVCPWHGWAFRLKNGELRDVSSVIIPTYRARIIHHESRPPYIEVEIQAI